MRPDSASTSSTVLTAPFSPASDLVTATAAVPDAEPSRPATTVPEPCGARPAANRATVAPWLPASSLKPAAGDDQRGVGRADALGAVRHKAGVAQRREHGVALGVVDDLNLADPC